MPGQTILAQRADTLLALHQPGNPVVLPTVWDAWSARLAVAAGFAALTVGSHPVADSIGKPDNEGMTFDDLLARLREVAAVRRAQLDALPVDAEVLSPFGRPTTLERLVRMRTFDLWAHVQDVRAGIGADGGWGSDGAVVSFQQISRSLMVVWSSLDAPAGAVVHLVVTGPGIEADVWASTDGAGRGAVSGPVPDPAVELELSWPDYALLSCGRITADETRAPVVMRGDADLGGRLVAELAITP